MNHLRRWVFAFFMLLFSNQCLAIDPIGWGVVGNFPNPVVVGIGPYSITYVFRNQIPLTLVKPLIIRKDFNTAEFTFNDQCTGRRLAPQATCTVQINLSPTTAGFKQVQLTIAGYDNNEVPLPTQSLTASATGGVLIQSQTLTALPASMLVGQSSNFSFQFTNSGSSIASGLIASSSTSNFTTTCGNQLAPGASCQINGIYTATTPGTQSVSATLTANQGDPVTISSSTTVFANTGITGTITTPLQTFTQTGEAYTVTFQFNNNENAVVLITENNTFPPEFTGIVDGCSGGSIPALGSCTITGQFQTAVANNYSIIAELIPTGYPTVTLPTTTTTSAPSSNNRVINFVNDCDFPVNFSLSGANVSASCSTDADCPSGSKCNPSSGCFWTNYAPSNGQYQLSANGGTNAVTIVYQSGSVVWSGAISGRTGCTGSSCLTANCNTVGGTASCDPGVGFAQPATQAEFTLKSDAVDNYDVEVINGFHIPIQITPSGVAANNYSCGSPGAPTPIDEFGACLFTNPAITHPNEFYWVGGGSGNTCNLTSPSCPAGELCGLNIGINPVCGDFLGLWTANEACSINATAAATYFNCTAPLTSPFPSTPPYTMVDLYGCKTPNASLPLLNSGYKAGADDTSCGCVNWQNLGVVPAILLPSSTQACIGSSTQWVTQVQPTLVWLKQFCSNYYIYPYDDVSSSFTCQNANPNTLDYTITFCPSGNSGLPVGATEGRNG